MIFVDDPLEATHIVVNTCGFIQDAKEESIGAILDACASYPGKAILAVGCLVERYREELRAGIPEVKGWLGLLEGRDVSELLGLFVSDDAGSPEVGRRRARKSRPFGA